MFGSGILDAAIGLVFVYLLVSLMVTAATEFLSGLFRWRSLHLWKGIRSLLVSDAKVRDLYSHPLVKSLSEPNREGWTEKLYSLSWMKSLLQGRSTQWPSYIPSRTFAVALIESIQGSQRDLQLEIDRMPDKASLEDLRKHLADWVDKLAPDTPWKASAAQWVASLPPSLSTVDANKLLRSTSLQSLINDLVDPADDTLKKSLVALFGESKGDMEELLKNVEVWFNNSMDRVSGWYKRRTQTVHLILAAIVVVSVNVDSVLIGNELFSNDTLRKALVAEAEVYARQNPNPPQPPDGQPSQDQEAIATAPAKAAGKLQDLETKISGLNLPIGWTCPVKATPGHSGPVLKKAELAKWQQQYRISPWGCKDSLVNVAAADVVRFHFWGWILSIFAVSLGAPFWFDMLNKIITIRSSGRAPEEKPKSPEKVPQPREPGDVPAASDQQKVVLEIKGATPG